MIANSALKASPAESNPPPTCIVVHDHHHRFDATVAHDLPLKEEAVR